MRQIHGTKVHQYDLLTMTIMASSILHRVSRLLLTMEKISQSLLSTPWLKFQSILPVGLALTSNDSVYVKGLYLPFYS